MLSFYQSHVDVVGSTLVLWRSCKRAYTPSHLLSQPRRHHDFYLVTDDFLSQYFAIPAFFVVFRETLEAVVLMAVMLQYLQRAGQHEMCKQVWLGGAVGGALAFLFG